MGDFLLELVKAEPSINILINQIERVTNGTISKKTLNRSLSFSLSLASGLAIVKIFTHISILYILIPGYLIAIILMKYVPRIFTAIAIDSGGVTSGSMTAALLLPITIGISSSLNSNLMKDAFGIISIVALTPFITIQILGLSYKQNLK